MTFRDEITPTEFKLISLALGLIILPFFASWLLAMVIGKGRGGR